MLTGLRILPWRCHSESLEEVFIQGRQLGCFNHHSLPCVENPAQMSGSLSYRQTNSWVHLFLLSFHSTDSYWAPAVSKVLCQAVKPLGQYQHSHSLQLETSKDFGANSMVVHANIRGMSTADIPPGLSWKWILTDLHLPAKKACGESCCWIEKYPNCIFALLSCVCYSILNQEYSTGKGFSAAFSSSDNVIHSFIHSTNIHWASTKCYHYASHRCKRKKETNKATKL